MNPTLDKLLNGVADIVLPVTRQAVKLNRVLKEKENLAEYVAPDFTIHKAVIADIATYGAYALALYWHQNYGDANAFVEHTRDHKGFITHTAMHSNHYILLSKVVPVLSALCRSVYSVALRSETFMNKNSNEVLKKHKLRWDRNIRGPQQ